MSDRQLKVRTPGKLILSGEHAVVHGHPAIAMAVNRFTEASTRKTSPLHLSFNLIPLNFKRQFTLNTLRKLKKDLQFKYHQFRLGEHSIRDVLKKPFELTLFTAINLIDQLKLNFPFGIDIATDSTIPVGCGMGSSASSVVSVLHVLTEFLDLDIDLEEYITLGTESENLQHGYSSGLDLHIAYHGGCIRYEQGQIETRTMPTFPMQLVHTGKPESTTGDCVTHAAEHFKDPAIGKAFSNVTNALDHALQDNNVKNIQNCITENHRLLNRIGVVPEKVNAFIAEIEKHGAAAKVCGAGSIHGDPAGMVLVTSNDDISELTESFGYTTLAIQGETHGTRVVV